LGLEGADVLPPRTVSPEQVRHLETVAVEHERASVRQHRYEPDQRTGTKE
jgi:hypothetical protein